MILKRKKELEADDIRELNGKYIPLFKKYDKRYKKSNYILIENLELDKTMETIEKAYQSVL